ncbi:hypothetical protein OF83DRAFT_1063183 [Amylostereum chailletii]|nr:hypothetical protein OF83DRAFT_1063183 [Amylostereum chailletii]
MDIFAEKLTLSSEPFADWVFDWAVKIGSRDLSWLTDRAVRGPYYADAQALRVSPEDVTVESVGSFSVAKLASRYDRILPRIQRFMAGMIGKDGMVPSEGIRDTQYGQTFLISQLLNLRSRKTNYHAVYNGLILWDNWVPKRFAAMCNRIGFAVSYDFRCRAVGFLSHNATQRAVIACADETKAKILAYDNFNWRQRAWEVSAIHKTLQHDQVSAILRCLWIPQGTLAFQVTNVHRFDECAGGRHRVPPEESLEMIVPNADDRSTFREAAALHIAYILTGDIHTFSHFRRALPPFSDPAAIPPHKDEHYFLPTFDQEQGSTRCGRALPQRGNMVVLEHYFLKVLSMPKSIFERIMMFVLGDRLTTARVRAAQDQRAIDRSCHRVDALASSPVLSGAMHICSNLIHVVGKNCWGGGTTSDPVSLQTLRDLLPHFSEINPRKIDFYEWLRFLDVILRALVISATAGVLGLPSSDTLNQWQPGSEVGAFLDICVAVADTFCIPSIDALEAEGIKTREGHTTSGHAVLLMHDLMTIREMRRAIKFGHPTRMLKYWMPMFYAGGSFNYANELMELNHNVHGDWPPEATPTLVAGMLVNTTGREGGFCESDLDVEHLNDKIKECAHGPNATPHLLEKVTPALGHAQDLTSRVYEELGVQDINEHHAEVKLQKDVQILVKHLDRAKVFRWSEDQSSKHTVVDLYRNGLTRLAGKDGGHAKHLERHKLRFRTRHDGVVVDGLDSDEDRWRREMLDVELLQAEDALPINIDISDAQEEQEMFEEGTPEEDDVFRYSE